MIPDLEREKSIILRRMKNLSHPTAPIKRTIFDFKKSFKDAIMTDRTGQTLDP
jgi:hypothetical protein